jgi:phosphoribosylformylglycinamidine cyclo-ligase
MAMHLSYKKSGVDIDASNATKTEIKQLLESSDSRVLNKVGAFASLIELPLNRYKQPVLVLKMEEPGSKQKLALKHNRIESLCFDLIHHLANDVIVMGARPLAVLDVIICGKLDKNIIKQLVSGMASACQEQDCRLVGGETSEQPKVLSKGEYVLAASMVGLVDKDMIIDGSKTKEGDIVLAIPSNGPHTNGYSLIRAVIKENPDLLTKEIEGSTFLDHIMRPHTAYYKQVSPLFRNPALHGMAHITGGGIKENLNRILPAHLNAEIDLSEIRILPVFKIIREAGDVDGNDMLRTFNLGVGMILVIERGAEDAVLGTIKKLGGAGYSIGRITKGNKTVDCIGRLKW